MKGLENLITLASKITVFVPATTHVGKPTNNAVQVQATAEMLSRLFGGATSSSAIGYWVSESAGLIKEKTTVVFAYCDQTALENHIEAVVDYCKAMKKDMGQESVALEVNGSMYFV